MTVDGHTDILRTGEAGGRVIRGGALRGAGYAAGILLGAATSVLLLRHLGVEDFGRYGIVVALLGIVAAVTDAGLTAVGSRELAILPAGGAAGAAAEPRRAADRADARRRRGRDRVRRARRLSGRRRRRHARSPGSASCS